MPCFRCNRIKMIEMLIERCALSVPQNHIARESDGLHNRFYETIVKHNKGCKNSPSILKQGNVEHMIIRRYELSDQ